MAGSNLGQLLRLSTFGESHGPAIGGVLEGCPAGLQIDQAHIQHMLARRRPGQSKFTSQRNEADEVEILSGLFNGKTTGHPIGLLIRNTDQKPKDYLDIANLYRPGHADFTYQHKYGIRDYRGGGRSSARETALRVAAGAIAMQLLAGAGVQIRACVEQIGTHQSTIDPAAIDWQAVNANPFFFADPSMLPQLEDALKSMRRAGDSIGAQLLLVVSGMPIGLGEPVFDRLDADLGKAMLSINASKAVSFGAGFACVQQRGSEHRDQITPNGFRTNNAGGVLGGISSGQDLIMRVAFKPTSSITIAGDTVDSDNKPTQVITKGRHDPCVGIRAVPIVEAMAALVLADHWLRNRCSRV